METVWVLMGIGVHGVGASATTTGYAWLAAEVTRDRVDEIKRKTLGRHAGRQRKRFIVPNQNVAYLSNSVWWRGTEGGFKELSKAAGGSGEGDTASRDTASYKGAVIGI
jgi:hypothetical protein